MQSYNHSAWQVYSDPSNGPDHPTYRYQSAPVPQRQISAPPWSNSADAPPLPPLPASLTPGGRNRGQSTSSNAPNLFFEQRSDYRRTSDAASRPPQSVYRHTQSYTAGVPRQQPPMPPRKPVELQHAQPPPPPIPPKVLDKKPSLPTLPPKIALYSQSMPSPVNNPWLPEKSPQVSNPSDDDKDLEIAMRLSEETANQRRREEEDLAKALEESRITSYQTFSAASSPVAVEVVVPDNVPRWNNGLPAPSPLSPSSMPQRPFDLSPTDRTLTESEGSTTTSPRMRAATQLSDDEAFARRLASGHEPEPAEEQQPPSQDNVHGPARPRQSWYPDAVSSIANTPGRSSAAPFSSTDHSLSRPEAIPESSLSRENSVKSASSQQSTRTDPRSLLSPTSPAGLRGSSPVPRPATTDPSCLSAEWPSASSEKRRLSVMAFQSNTPLSQSTTPLSDTAPSIHANQFVEQELLLGISLGFTPPVISSVLQPMSGPMPNIIFLPHGKSPPLHLQAPSWRHLLKLMARLSGTRIEPTVEAMAVASGELKLRTVVQFVRVHHSAREWRILLYLTIDHPVPANSPNAWKFTNGDVGTLPYSYTLSTVPALLRDGVDSAMATYYVIPSTPKTPYPTLPIDFPTMAMYLQSALEDSRRAMHDSSSGLRKLAKNVDSYYANEPQFVGVDEGPERRSFGGVLKKVIGRGNKQSKGNRGGNAEVYELVTPFVPEEWG